MEVATGDTAHCAFCGAAVEEPRFSVAAGDVPDFVLCSEHQERPFEIGTEADRPRDAERDGDLLTALLANLQKATNDLDSPPPASTLDELRRLGLVVPTVVEQREVMKQERELIRELAASPAAKDEARALRELSAQADRITGKPGPAQRLTPTREELEQSYAELAGDGRRRRVTQKAHAKRLNISVRTLQRRQKDTDMADVHFIYSRSQRAR